MLSGTTVDRSPVSISDEAAVLQRSYRQSHELLQELQRRGKLDHDDQRLIERFFVNAEDSPATIYTSSAALPQVQLGFRTQRLQRPSAVAQRYIGEGSDVSFYNSVKGLLQSRAVKVGASSELESYGREDANSTANLERQFESASPNYLAR